jgi:transcriptional regulator with XRE-family HTH domain
VDGRIGDELRQERRARGIELEQIEAATGIRARFLRAIEDEEWEALPGEFYARAFTRTYAGYLGLDPADFALGNRPDRIDEDPGGPRVEPRLVPETPSARQPHRWRPLAAVLAALVVAAAIVVLVVALSGGGSTRSAAPAGGGRPAQGKPRQHQQQKLSPAPAATSLRLTATAEVWVCLLNGSGKPLIDGQILPAGDEAGPFHSRRYSMSFGNGGVALTVDGEAVPTPESSSPIGFAIKGGKLSEIPEGERPECA